MLIFVLVVFGLFVIFPVSFFHRPFSLLVRSLRVQFVHRHLLLPFRSRFGEAFLIRSVEEKKRVFRVVEYS